MPSRRFTDKAPPSATSYPPSIAPLTPSSTLFSANPNALSQKSLPLQLQASRILGNPLSVGSSPLATASTGSQAIRQQHQAVIPEHQHVEDSNNAGFSSVGRGDKTPHRLVGSDQGTAFAAGFGPGGAYTSTPPGLGANTQSSAVLSMSQLPGLGRSIITPSSTRRFTDERLGPDPAGRDDLGRTINGNMDGNATFQKLSMPHGRVEQETSYPDGRVHLFSSPSGNGAYSRYGNGTGYASLQQASVPNHSTSPGSRSAIQPPIPNSSPTSHPPQGMSPIGMRKHAEEGLGRNVATWARTSMPMQGQSSRPAGVSAHMPYSATPDASHARSDGTRSISASAGQGRSAYVRETMPQAERHGDSGHTPANQETRGSRWSGLGHDIDIPVNAAAQGSTTAGSHNPSRPPVIPYILRDVVALPQVTNWSLWLENPEGIRPRGWASP